MKFLIFNLTVAAALFYLVTADRSEFQAAAGRVHDAAGEIKTMAEEAVDEGRKMLGRKTSRVEPAPAPVQPARLADAAKKVPETRVPATPPPAPPADTTAEPPPAPKTAVAKSPAPMPTVIEPAVAKRRDEVLKGVAPAERRLSLKAGERMMTPEQRRKELFNLAEEMELLYARTVSR